MRQRLSRDWADNAQSSKDFENRKFKILVSGKEGSGKTEFAGTWPKPFIIASEEGTLTLMDKDIPFFFLSNDMPIYDTILMILLEAKMHSGSFAEGGKFSGIETIVFDSFTALNQKIMAEILESNNRVKPEFDDWNSLKYRMGKICSLIPELPYHVIGTVGIASKDDLITKMAVPTIDIDGSYRERLPHDFDFSLWLTCQSRGSVNKYICYTKEHLQKYSKARVPKKWPPLPKEIENIDYDYIYNYYQENLKK
jgi:hypothetical protein